MAAISPERWAQLSPHIDELLTLPPLERGRRLDEIAANDRATASDLRELLNTHDGASRDAFLGGVADEQLLPARVQAGDLLGPWRLVEVIGEGGMGSVWRAQRSDGRYEGAAAIKLLKSGLFDAGAQERFRREGAILARLRHSGIAQLLDAGVTAQGQPCLVLELVQGERIDGWCRARALSVRARLELFEQVLDAVSAAHAQLAIHRDLKPSNILVGSDGRVKLLDFGIARLLPGADAEQTALTREGSFALTPEYAAPEQFEGGVLSVATDVYALGVVLFELLTATHPRGLEAGANPMQHMRAALDGSVQRASVVAAPALRPALRGDLDNILAKTLQVRAAERYASVAALHDDLTRHLRNEPVGAHASGLGYRAAKLLRRRPLESVLVAVAVLSLVTGVAGMAAFARQSQRDAAEALAARDAAAREARAAREQRDIARGQTELAQSFTELNTWLMSEAAPSGKPVTAATLLQRSVELVDRQTALPPATRVAMLSALGSQFWSIDDHARARSVLQRAFDLSRELDDPRVRAGAACDLAAELWSANEADKAEALVKTHLDALPDKPQNLATRIDCLITAGQVARARDDAATAVSRSEQAQRLLPGLDVPSPVLTLRVTMDLAQSYAEANRLQDALAAGESALQQLHTLGRDETTSAATVHNNMAVLLVTMGRMLEAAVHMERSVALRSSADGGGELSPTVRANLARVLLYLGRTQAAEQALGDAVEAARRKGNQLGLRFALMARSAVLRESARLDEAERVLDEAERVMRATLKPDNGAFSNVLSGRSLLASARGQHRRAMAWADASLKLAEGSDDAAYFVPLSMLLRAEVAALADEPEVARRDAEQLLTLWRKTLPPGSVSSNLGRAQLALAQALAQQGQKDSAAAAYAQALRHLVPTLGETGPQTLAARRGAAALQASVR